ncbi:cation:proton antiporter domain-containing protein [Anthocerotibacter panamensis]|uniref:cation:proton antiporter domain-containing protein n=1 Tax=Anthocerotibacter panamensis TaxID=2857077 RepID=UPI001C406C01|nr:cation:proton antiporter [Anthocerotibacter panamensis]
MAAGHNFILDLVTVLGTAALGGYLANRLKQPVLLGYLVSGLIVGPFGLKLLGDVEQIQGLAEVGVAFLLFALGVEFSLKDLNRVRGIALGGGALQIGLTTILVALLAYGTGWVDSPIRGIFLGALLSLSSTAVVLKTLAERGEVQTLHGQVMLAILIVQDLALGLMLAVLPALNQPPDAIGWALLAAVGKGLLFAVGAVAVGVWLVPPLIKAVARSGSSELFLLTVLALCLGVALTTAAFGLSIEMGAFVAGLMISEIEYADQALAKVFPLRDTFATLFFASIGMLINPFVLGQNLGLILALVAVVMLGKALVILPIVLGFRYSFKTAVIASLGLNQIGEFSFVLAQVGLSLGLIDEKKYVLVLGTTAITLVVTPLFIRFAQPLAEGLLKLPVTNRLFGHLTGVRELSIPETISGHVVVAGYGRVGQILVKLLLTRNQKVLVIDNSDAAIQLLRLQGLPYILGDADSELVLEKAHLERANALTIALPDPTSTRLALKRALEFAPELLVMARAHTSSEIEVLAQLGAKEVVQPEFEAALEMGASLLTNLGEPKSAIEQALDTIRAGRYRTLLPEESQGQVLKDLLTAAADFNGEWILLTERCRLVGQTLAEADIRNLTGASVMAIERAGQTMRYPTGQTLLQADDRLLVVGAEMEMASFRDLVTGRLEAPQGLNDWVTLAEPSPLVGQTLTQTDLRRRHNVVVQAVRRQGKLYTSPGGDLRLEQGDCLLLRGEPEAVRTVALLVNPEQAVEV